MSSKTAVEDVCRATSSWYLCSGWIQGPNYVHARGQCNTLWTPPGRALCAVPVADRFNCHHVIYDKKTNLSETSLARYKTNYNTHGTPMGHGCCRRLGIKMMIPGRETFSLGQMRGIQACRLPKGRKIPVRQCCSAPVRERPAVGVSSKSGGGGKYGSGRLVSVSKRLDGKGCHSWRCMFP